MKIAFLGSRGIPARYSGFETFYEQIAVRLVKRGHDVTVYNRSHFIKDIKTYYQGVKIVSLPSIATKHLDTITNTLISSFHALFSGYDIVYYCIVGNSPLAWIPKVLGARTLLNIDGQDWARDKWSGFARWYQKKCEWIATKTADVIIADAKAIRKRYRQVFNIESVFVPYGANIIYDEKIDVLDKWKLKSRQYILFVGRLVPDNAVDILIRAYQQVVSDMKLVIVGDAPYADEYKAKLKTYNDNRVIFTGYAFGRDYVQLSSHSYLFVLPSAIEGTRPVLLDQMGFGNCVVFRDGSANKEVVGDFGCIFDGGNPVENLRDKLKELLSETELVDSYRKKVRSRINEYYNWEWITSFYEDLFYRLKKRERLIPYDEYLQKQGLSRPKLCS
jgi:glycosyltransferase involved in cell wall biosynthesis